MKSGLNMEPNGDRPVGRLIIHAPNVHTGGGAVLLSAVLGVRQNARESVLFCDSRMAVDRALEGNVTVHRFSPSITSRFAAERKLREIARPDDVVLAFGNLPPIFRLPSQTTLFLQNRYLVDPAMSLNGFRLGSRLRLLAERLWVKSRLGNADRIIVQTSTMAWLVQAAFGRDAEIAGFDAAGGGQARQAPPSLSDRHYDFIYVSSGEPHKNHAVLLEAWAVLARSGVKPSLALTLAPERSAALIALLERINRDEGANIFNLGMLRPDDVADAYHRSGALIFPSLAESFGLPLVEAAEFGLPILGSELDFVRDVAVPVETFDPRSPRSIARAVRRFLGMPPDLDARVGASGFLKQVLEGRA